MFCDQMVQNTFKHRLLLFFLKKQEKERIL